MRKILLTGAAGRIGSAFFAYAQERYAWRLLDRSLADLSAGQNVERVAVDLGDLDACRRACEGVDTVVHMAANPSTTADFYQSLLNDNFKATYNVFLAAHEMGCRRVVCASSVQVIDGYPLDVQAHPETPPKPLNMYAVSKIFAESVAHYFAHTTPLSAIAIRIGSFEHNPVQPDPDARVLSTFVSARDMSHLIECCVESDLNYAVVHGVSDNRFKRLDITSTREWVGYTPQDDSFEKFETGLHYRDRWYKEWEREDRRPKSS